MPNLRILEFNLNKRSNLIVLPNLTSSSLLEELTMQNTNLKQMSSTFCNSKRHLKKLDLSMNEFESLTLIFDKCTHLNFLDLSYNRIESLEHMFTQTSNLLYLVLDHNRIVEIGQKDLSFLDNLLELTISGNNLHFIHENAFDSLKNLKKLDLSGNSLVSLPMASVAYKSLGQLSVRDNVDLIIFPDEGQFFELFELSVHYPYHCCQFRGRKEKSVMKTEGVDRKRDLDGENGLLIARPYEAKDGVLIDLELRILEMPGELTEK